MLTGIPEGRPPTQPRPETQTAEMISARVNAWVLYQPVYHLSLEVHHYKERR